MSTEKRKAQQLKKEKAIRKAKMVNGLKLGLAILIALLLVAGLIYWIVYETVIVTPTVSDQSAGLTSEGMIENVVATDYVTLPSYTNMVMNYYENAMSEEELNEMITSELSLKSVYLQEYDKAIANGDRINIDFVGSIDGVEFEGGNTGGAGTDVTVGQGQYIAGFEEQLVGHKVGETFDINVTFPEDYAKEDLQGKDAVFKITVNGIYSIPELTDAYVKSEHGDVASTVEEYKEYLQDQHIEGKKESFAFLFVQNSATIKSYPNEYVRIQMGREKFFEEQSFNYMKEFGLVENWSDYIQMSDAEFEAEVRIRAEETVKKQLLIQAIFESENMTVTQDDLNKVVLEFESDLSAYDQVIEEYGQGYIYQLAMEDIVKNFLVEQITVSK